MRVAKGTQLQYSGPGLRLGSGVLGGGVQYSLPYAGPRVSRGGVTGV